jgi:hypothetical protein
MDRSDDPLDDVQFVIRGAARRASGILDTVEGVYGTFRAQGA